MKNRNIQSSILIVDDEPEICELINCILSEENYKIEIARSGNDALVKKEIRSFDLILLDINMPGMNGFDFCHHLKDSFETKDIPVIFITGNSSPKEKVKGFDCGAIDYITKPFSSIELIARVKTHLELKHNRDLLKEMALMDGLTNLYNHTYIHERLSEEISNSRRHNLDLSLIMFDIDHFKMVNDTFGHKFGDGVLKKVSTSIQDIIREEDIAGRYGGEEFIVILPNTSRESAYRVAEKIRQSVKEISWIINDFQITVSGGVHTLEDEAINTFIEKTDILLYKAKDSGRDKIYTNLSLMNKPV